MEKREDDAYLVTGNQKHYPIREFIVSPVEMIRILEEFERNEREQEGRLREVEDPYSTYPFQSR